MSPIFSGRSRRCERDVDESGRLVDRARRVGVRERERAGTAARLVGLLGDLDERLHDLLRAVHPLVVLAPAPDERAEAAAGLERVVDVAHGRDRAGEEHRPEARERVVERVGERRCLDVGDLEARVRDAELACVRFGRLDEARRDVDAERGTGRADELGQLHRRVAEAAADVEHAVALGGRERLHRGGAVQRERGDDQVLEADEAVEEHAVPGALSLFVLGENGRHP